MEDVTHKSYGLIRRGLNLLLIVALGCNALYAATQGNIGSTTSRGSISISLVIPNNTQLVVERSDQQLEGIEQQHVCLKVFDSIKLTSTGFYTIAGLNGELHADYGIGETNYAEFSQQISLENVHHKLSDRNQSCGFETSIPTATLNHNQSALLLMLIAE